MTNVELATEYRLNEPVHNQSYDEGLTRPNHVDSSDYSPYTSSIIAAADSSTKGEYLPSYCACMKNTSLHDNSDNDGRLNQCTTNICGQYDEGYMERPSSHEWMTTMATCHLRNVIENVLPHTYYTSHEATDNIISGESHKSDRRRKIDRPSYENHIKLTCLNYNYEFIERESRINNNNNNNNNNMLYHPETSPTNHQTGTQRQNLTTLHSLQPTSSLQTAMTSLIDLCSTNAQYESCQISKPDLLQRHQTYVKNPASVARRNARERKRIKNVNQAFDNLRKRVPCGGRNNKISKVETLRSAIEYIRALQALINKKNCNDSEDEEKERAEVGKSSNDENDSES